MRHGSGILANGSLLCIYCNPAYPLRAHVQRPFEGNLPQKQKDFNNSMKIVRVSVEWVFKQIIRYFAFLDFKSKKKREDKT